MDHFQASDVIQNISTEPYILFLGEEFDAQRTENQKILNLQWSCVFTSKNDVNLTKALNNTNRITRNILEEGQLLSNALDKKNYIISIF